MKNPDCTPKCHPTEEKAERLYGPAPEGDEATDASREVPDPGESPSYLPPGAPPGAYALNGDLFGTFRVPKLPFSAALLDGTHLGKRARITDGQSSATGQITKITHEADLIYDQPLFGPEQFDVGRMRVKVEMARHHVVVSPEATVELLD